MRQLLNVKAIQSAKPRSKEYLLADGDGLFLRVFPTGRKTWIFMYSHRCRRRKLSIGDISDLPWLAPANAPQPSAASSVRGTIRAWR